MRKIQDLQPGDLIVSQVSQTVLLVLDISETQEGERRPWRCYDVVMSTLSGDARLSKNLFGRDEELGHVDILRRRPSG